ncbi:hypothetical protein EST38_g7393 [Candolleomyces aberdarensis]|uniref:RING-type domain-containing protein n=1 Tax=Candolleomyces aberdarensis TaxID=2316362 RepID=A0A4Q2DIK0_9AGAR|nr:hypothetical protein EST38_g7393 [Candolleomyces aberdarensis]
MIPGCGLCFFSFIQTPAFLLPCGHCYCEECFKFSAKHDFPCWYRCNNSLPISIKDGKLLRFKFSETREEDDKKVVIAHKQATRRDRDIVDITIDQNQPELDNAQATTIDHMKARAALIASMEDTMIPYDMVVLELQKANGHLAEMIVEHESLEASHREAIRKLDSARFALLRLIFETSPK